MYLLIRVIERLRIDALLFYTNRMFSKTFPENFLILLKIFTLYAAVYTERILQSVV